MTLTDTEREPEAVGTKYTRLDLRVVTEVLESRARVNAVFNPRVREGGAAEDTVRAGMVQALRSRVGADPLAVPVVA